MKEHVSKAVEKTKNKIKRTTTNADFKVSDRVLRANISNQQRKGGKLEANYLGSCVITAIQDQSTNLQGSKGVIISKVNIGHVKLHWCLKKNVWCTIIFIYVTSTWRPITSHSPPAVSSYSHFWSIITWCHPLCHYCFTITWLNHLAKRKNSWHVERYILKGIFLYHFFFFTKVYFWSYTKKKRYGFFFFLQLKILLNIKGL